MGKFFLKVFIFLLLLSSPLFIVIINKKIEAVKINEMDKIVEMMKENSKICEEIIELYEKNSPTNSIGTFRDFDAKTQDEIYRKYEKFNYTQKGIIMNKIEKLLKDNQKHNYFFINIIIPDDKKREKTYYQLYIPFRGNVPKIKGSYYYFKEQKALLDHVIYMYEYFNKFNEKKGLLIEYYKYYFPFEAGYQRALDNIYKNENKSPK